MLEAEAICQDDYAFILPNGFPSGGTYGGTEAIGSNFDPLAAGAGTHSISYEYTDGNNCTNTVSQQIVVIDCNLNISESGVNE